MALPSFVIFVTGYGGPVFHVGETPLAASPGSSAPARRPGPAGGVWPWRSVSQESLDAWEMLIKCLAYGAIARRARVDGGPRSPREIQGLRRRPRSAEGQRSGRTRARRDPPAPHTARMGRFSPLDRAVQRARETMRRVSHWSRDARPSQRHRARPAKPIELRTD